jgi:death-on-curing protein
MMWTFLDVAAIEIIHDSLIETYGGSHGLRDRGLLESAVARAEMRVHFDPGVGVAAVAASLAFGLIKNHAFLDGNKRIGLAALVAFLRLNGHRLAVSVADQVATVQRLAASEITEDEWTAWVERVIAPLPAP